MPDLLNTININTNYHNVNCLVLMFGKCAVNNVTILIHYHQCQAAMWSCLQVLIINQE